MELDDDPQTAPPVPSDELGGDDAGVPEVAWGFSTLTASGCPLEISFNTTAPCVRYTAEVAGAEHDHADRMALALGLTAELSGGQRFPPELVDELVRLQHCGTLHWGAWIGGRHDGRRSRFKVYAEVPRDMPSRDLAARWLPAPATRGRRARIHCDQAWPTWLRSRAPPRWTNRFSAARTAESPGTARCSNDYARACRMLWSRALLVPSQWLEIMLRSARLPREIHDEIDKGRHSGGDQRRTPLVALGNRSGSSR